MAKEQTLNFKALIVDDDVHICKFIQSYTEYHNFETTVLSAPENFSQLYSDALDFIILDLSMPQVDGIELIRLLGEQRSEAQIILVSSAERSILMAAQDLATNHNLSVVGILDKPIKPDNLTSLIQKVLDRLSDAAQTDLALSSLAPEGTSELPSLEELKAALEADEFDVYFQPKISLASQLITGAEALARWNHPDKGFISPDYFIRFAEEFGLIEQMTVKLISRTCAHVSDWEAMPDGFQISVNISEISLGDLKFPDRLTQIIKTNGMTPSQFILEITESTLSINPKTAMDVLTRLRLQGYSLSIDDFGTGHSSLARLRQIPFGELKIDRSFVAESDTSAECRIIVKNTIDLAGSLGLTVVAEGAEDQKHIDILAGFGCNLVQGYYYSKALPFDQFIKWYDNWNLSQSTDDQDPLSPALSTDA